MEDKEKLTLLDQDLSDMWDKLSDSTEVTQKTSGKVSETIGDEKECFLDVQKERLQEIDERIKELEQEKEEKQKLIPEMDASFVERISLNILSEILTEEELKIVKRGRGFQRLNSAIQKKDTYSDLIDKIFEWIKDLSDEERIVVAEYLWIRQIILVDMQQYNACMWYLDLGFCYDDFEDEMYMYSEVRNNLYKLWLGKYIKFVWDSCYRVDRSIVVSAKKKVFESTLVEDVWCINREIEAIDDEMEQLGLERKDVWRKIEAVSSYWLPLEHALSVLDWENSADWNIVSSFSDKEKRVYVVLSDYSYYAWWWCWMEYWVKIYVKRWSKTDMAKIVYRDAHSSYYDDRSKAYTTIDKVEVLDDKVLVTVSRWPKTKANTYTFPLEKEEWVVEEVLSTEEQQKFKEHVEKEKKRLLQLETRENGRMPSFHDLVYMQASTWYWWEREMKYDEAKIVDDHMDLWRGVYIMVIKTQIDSCAGDWKQFAWLKYKITPEETTLLGRESLWQSELMRWKQIHMSAE